MGLDVAERRKAGVADEIDLVRRGVETVDRVVADRLREYLQKGGFIVFNDFELEQWDNFEAQSRRIIPHARWVRLDRAQR